MESSQYFTYLFTSRLSLLQWSSRTLNKSAGQGRSFRDDKLCYYKLTSFSIKVIGCMAVSRTIGTEEP